MFHRILFIFQSHNGSAHWRRTNSFVSLKSLHQLMEENSCTTNLLCHRLKTLMWPTQDTVHIRIVRRDLQFIDCKTTRKGMNRNRKDSIVHLTKQDVAIPASDKLDKHTLQISILLVIRFNFFNSLSEINFWKSCCNFIHSPTFHSLPCTIY